MWTLEAEIVHVVTPKMELLNISDDQTIIHPRQYISNLPWEHTANPNSAGVVNGFTFSVTGDAFQRFSS